MSSSRRLIAVCGESDPQTPVADIAFELGKGIAERGAVLICGVCRYEMPIVVSSGPAAIMEEAAQAISADDWSGSVGRWKRAAPASDS